MRPPRRRPDRGALTVLLLGLVLLVGAGVGIASVLGGGEGHESSSPAATVPPATTTSGPRELQVTAQVGIIVTAVRSRPFGDVCLHVEAQVDEGSSDSTVCGAVPGELSPFGPSLRPSDPTEDGVLAGIVRHDVRTVRVRLGARTSRVRTHAQERGVRSYLKVLRGVPADAAITVTALDADDHVLGTQDLRRP